MLGVDVCLDEEKIKNAPHCPHGKWLKSGVEIHDIDI